MGKHYRCDWLSQPDWRVTGAGGGDRVKETGGKEQGGRDRSGVKGETKEGNRGGEKQTQAEKKTLHLRDSQKSKGGKRGQTVQRSRESQAAEDHGDNRCFYGDQPH